MSDNQWKQPEAPPPPLFTGQKEKDIVKQVADEVIERVIGTSILYYPISIKHSDFHPLYGEAINKTYLPPIHVEVLAEWEGEETTTTGFGIDKQSKVTIHFHKRRLTEDQNLFVREGDFIQYGEQKYEIVKLSQPTLLFGQVATKVEISAQCVRARDGSFPSESYPDPEEDDPRYTAPPACDPIEEIRVLTGDTTSTGGSGEQPCGEVYERPGTPPPPLFTGRKESNLVKQVNDEVLERVVGQQVVYFPISVPNSDFHELYGEAINKTFLPPIHVFAAVEWKGSETTTTSYGIDRKSAIDVKFHKRRLTEDQNLFVREGDFVLYGSILYEIITVGQPKLLFGKIDEKFEIVASCIRAREGTFRLSEVEGTVSDFDLDSVTACENANIITPDGVDNTMSNVGSGEGVFRNKTGANFNMKTLAEGDNITITSTSDEITINSSGGGGAWDGQLDGSAGITGSLDVSGSTSFGNLSADTHQFTGSLQVAGHILPDEDEVYNLGSATKQFKEIFVATGSIWFGGTNRFQVDSGGISVQSINGNIVPATLVGLGVTPEMAMEYFQVDSLSEITVAQWAAYAMELAGISQEDLFTDDDFQQTINLASSTGSEGGVFQGTATTASYVAASNVDGLTELIATTEGVIQSQIDSINTQIANLEFSGGGEGTTTVAVAALGSGIFTMADDGDGPNRLLLEEYANNPVAYTGKTLYLSHVAQDPVVPFSISSKFYFNEGGVWHPSHFFHTEPPSEPQHWVYPDMHDILTLDARHAPDHAILTGLDQNSASYGGRAIYLQYTGSSPVGVFIDEGKYYFNEGGTWHASNFYESSEENE